MRLTRAVQMYWLAHLASASLVPRPLAARRRAISCADCFMTECALGPHSFNVGGVMYIFAVCCECGAGASFSRV